MTTDSIIGDSIKKKAGDIMSLAFSMYAELKGINPLDLHKYELSLARKEKIIWDKKCLNKRCRRRINLINNDRSKQVVFIKYPKNTNRLEIIETNAIKVRDLTRKIKIFTEEVKNVRHKANKIEFIIENL